MTKNRCIELLKKMKHMFTETCAKIDENTALDMAVEAIEEIQQYRAIGTVEGYERAIQSSIENYNLYREYKAKAQEYEAIGTTEEFKALKEHLKIIQEAYENTDGYKDGYAKAIDEFSERLKNELKGLDKYHDGIISFYESVKNLDEIAEQMKGAVQ